MNKLSFVIEEKWKAYRKYDEAANLKLLDFLFKLILN